MNNSGEAVMRLYAERINNHRFDDLVPLIAADTVFWFGDGSHVWRNAIRAAFEATWTRLTAETYRLDALQWLMATNDAAACCYRFHWQATLAGVPVEDQGRGTSVLARRAEGWQIVHEHLSAQPAETLR